MIRESADFCKKALTISLRYSCVRRQFSAKKNEPDKEQKIIDYKTHQRRLFPILSSAFAMHFGAVEVTKIYDALIGKLEQARSNDPSMEEAIEALKETHATSSGLKAFCT